MFEFDYESEKEFWEAVKNCGILKPSSAIWKRFLSKITCDKDKIDIEWIHFVTAIYCNYQRDITFFVATEHHDSFDEFISFIDGNGYIIKELESPDEYRRFKVLEANT